MSMAWRIAKVFLFLAVSLCVQYDNFRTFREASRNFQGIRPWPVAKVSAEYENEVKRLKVKVTGYLRTKNATRAGDDCRDACFE